MAVPKAKDRGLTGGLGAAARGLGIAALASIALAAPLAPARAETAPAAAPTPSAPAAPDPAVASDTIDTSLSPECRVPGSKLYTLARLKAVKQALREKRPVRVLSIGSSSGGLGASANYPVRLESALEHSLPDVDVQIESRGLPGEIAIAATERLRTMVAEVEPDLVIWQVGSNDALARVDLGAFDDALDEAVKWILSHDIDVVLVDPLFTRSLAEDAYYQDMVARVRGVASREAVPLVRRYEAMRYLSGQAATGEFHTLGHQFRLNDLGLRCMAEHVTRAITLSLLKAEPAATGTAVSTAPGPAPNAPKP